MAKFVEKFKSAYKYSDRERVHLYNVLMSFFYIAHADALDIMAVDIDKQFLINQRQKGRPGSLIGVDLTYQKNKHKRFKKLEEFKKKENLMKII